VLLPRQTGEQDVLVEHALGQRGGQIPADARLPGRARPGDLEERQAEERSVMAAVRADDGWLVGDDDLLHPLAAVLADAKHCFRR
jgi:hypothetical protein